MKHLLNLKNTLQIISKSIIFLSISIHRSSQLKIILFSELAYNGYLRDKFELYVPVPYTGWVHDQMSMIKWIKF